MVKHNEDDIYIEKISDRLIFDPYNKVNVQIEVEDVVKILQQYGINLPIHNINLYKRAFVHRSYVKLSQDTTVVTIEKPIDCLPLHTKSNERLEFIGDGVLECITKYYLYRRFPKENEGFMTEKKIALVKNEAIGRIAHEMGLHKWMILSKSTEEKQTRTNMKKLGCLFEAFLGALFLDFNKMYIEDTDGLFNSHFVTGPGFQVVQLFVESIFEKHVDWIELIRNDDNYKNILQVKIQKEFKVTPDYMEIEPYNQVLGYHMGVYLCLGQSIHMVDHSNSIHLSQFNSLEEIHEYVARYGRILVFLGEGIHKIKKKAEQLASNILL